MPAPAMPAARQRPAGSAAGCFADSALPSPQGKSLKHYVYVSSAGAYKANSVEPMHVEGDERKASAGELGREGAQGQGAAARLCGLLLASCRPPLWAAGGGRCGLGRRGSRLHDAPPDVPTPLQPPHPSPPGHVEVEKYLAASGLPFTVFQPQYIYGPHTAKDCEQWFMDRIARCAQRPPPGAAGGSAAPPMQPHPAQPRPPTLPCPLPWRRDRPVPIPAPRVQLVTLTHVGDVAAMLAAVPGNKAAIGQQYNLVSDRCITLNGIAKAVGKAMGKEAKVVNYTVSGSKAEGFPFRWGLGPGGAGGGRELAWRCMQCTGGEIWLLQQQQAAGLRGGVQRLAAAQLTCRHAAAFPAAALDHYNTPPLPPLLPPPPSLIPCRIVHFFASAEKAKRELGWAPQHNFLADVDALVAEYQAQGRQDKEVDFSNDDKVLAAA
jgi:nucleoside-diphosphate-sugar epimerase